MAKKSISINKGGAPFGSVIVMGDKIIAKGYNQVFVKNDPTKHAEIIAINNAAKKLKNLNDFKNCTLYSLGECCLMCKSAIVWARIPKVYYGLSNSFLSKHNIERKKILDNISLMEKNNNFENVENNKCKKVFIEWSNSKNRIIYKLK